MPGGGLYRRVANGLNAAAVGPDALASKSNPEKGKAATRASLASDALADEDEEEEVCDVRAFSIWYWSDEGKFVPETMYLNAKDVGKTPGEPRLIVSLSSFEALSQAYVMAIEREGIKAHLLQESQDLLAGARIGYHKELLHLREMLGMAQEQMRLARQNRLEEFEQQRKEEFEKIVRETDVHYFNIVDYLEPELKAIVKDAVKQFNRDLMRENFDLRDRLALHEGSEDDDGLVERLATMMLGRGHSPAKIVKILQSMISDRKQSDDFRDTLRELLGLAKVDRRVDDDEGDRRALQAKEQAKQAAKENFERQRQQEKAAEDAQAAADAQALADAAAAAQPSPSRREVDAIVAEAVSQAQSDFMKQLKEKDDEVGEVSNKNQQLQIELEDAKKQMEALKEMAKTAAASAPAAAAASAPVAANTKASKKQQIVEEEPEADVEVKKVVKKVPAKKKAVQEIVEVEEEEEEAPPPKIVKVKKKRPPPETIYVEESDDEEPPPPTIVKKKKEKPVASGGVSAAPPAAAALHLEPPPVLSASASAEDAAALAAVHEALQEEKQRVYVAESSLADLERKCFQLEKQLQAAKAMVGTTSTQPAAQEFAVKTGLAQGGAGKDPSLANGASARSSAHEEGRAAEPAGVNRILQPPSEKAESVATVGTAESCQLSARVDSADAAEAVAFALGGSQPLDPTSARSSMSTSRSRKTLTDAGSLDRNFDNVSRSGPYDAKTGKPVALMEEEINRERSTRLKVVAEAQKLTTHVDDLEEVKHSLEEENITMKAKLEEAEAKLEKLIDGPVSDESSGAGDVRLFCQWLERRYGSIDAGFRALDEDNNSTMCLTEFVAALQHMGWIKVVGKRLFKIMDPENSGRVTLEMLQECNNKVMSMKDEEAILSRPITSLTESQGPTTHGRDHQVDEAARVRVRELEEEKRILQERLAAAEKPKPQNTMRNNPIVNEEKLKTTERKVESMKIGYDKIKNERDQMTSKMTAAMWKCREANILQVKYMREAEEAREEMRKVQQKLEHFKATYRLDRSSSLVDTLSSAPRRSTIMGPSMSWSGSMGSGAAMGGTGRFQLVAEDSEGSSNGSPPTTAGAPLQIDSLSGHVTDPPGEGRPGSAGRPLSASQVRQRTPENQFGSLEPGTRIRCPKCRAMLRVEGLGSPSQRFRHDIAKAQSQATALRYLVQGDPVGDEAPEIVNNALESRKSVYDTNVSAEDFVAKLSDDEILFGRPLTAVSEHEQSEPRKRMSMAGQSQRQSSSYRDKADMMGETGQQRWQALYSEAEDRHRASMATSKQERNSILNQDSQNLIRHAQNVHNKLYGFPGVSEPSADASGSPGRGARRQSTRSSLESLSTMSGEASLRQGGVGGAPGSKPTQSGSVHLGRPKPSLKVEGTAALAQMAQSSSTLSQLLGHDPLTASAMQLSQGLAGTGSMSSERTMSPDTAAQTQRSGRSQANQSKERGSRRVPSGSPDRSPPRDVSQSQPLLVVQNSLRERDPASLSMQTLTLNGEGPELRHSPPPRPLVGSPSKIASRRAQELSEFSTMSSTMLPFDDLEVGGTSNWNSMPGHETKLHGMWLRSMTTKSFGDSANIEEELGSGLPLYSPDRLNHRKPGGLKSSSSSTHLPQLSSPPDSRKKQITHPSEAKMMMSTSMPDLSSQLALPLLADRGNALVKTPPLAGEERAMISPKSSMKRQKKGAGIQSAGADGNTPPFEVPLLYVGKPPPPHGSEYGKLAGSSFPGANVTGASHTIPTGLRKQLMMSATAFELADHVQRHAGVADTAAELGIPPLIHKALVPQAPGGVGVLS